MAPMRSLRMKNCKLNSLFGYAPFVTLREINLNDEAERMFSGVGDNPLLDPEFCSAWVEYLSKGTDYTYGGYMEQREFLWRGSYLKPYQAIHLGVDINVPIYTPVYCPLKFVVREIFRDYDSQGGWGGRVLVETPNGLIIFAHINPEPLQLDKACYPPGTLIGRIANSETNGGWFPHLHLQGIDKIERMKNIDGYGYSDPFLKDYYPNPLEILELL